MHPGRYLTACLDNVYLTACLDNVERTMKSLLGVFRFSSFMPMRQASSTLPCHAMPCGYAMPAMAYSHGIQPCSHAAMRAQTGPLSHADSYIYDSNEQAADVHCSQVPGPVVHLLGDNGCAGLESWHRGHNGRACWGITEGDPRRGRKGGPKGRAIPIACLMPCLIPRLAGCVAQPSTAQPGHQGGDAGGMQGGACGGCLGAPRRPLRP